MILNVELVFTFISLIFFLYYFSSRCRCNNEYVNGFSVGGLSGNHKIFVKLHGKTMTLTGFDNNSTASLSICTL